MFITKTAEIADKFFFMTFYIAHALDCSDV